jgi:hypothetical protein
MPILDGRCSASGLPESHTALVNSYGDEIGRQAVERQREDGTPLDGAVFRRCDARDEAR